MPNETPQSPSFSAGRRWYISFHVVLGILAIMSLVAMANYLAIRHPRRYNWNPEGKFQLSPLTVQVLHSITNQVKVVVYYDPDEPLYEHVTTLLKEYTLLSPRINVDIVNYINDPAKAGYVRTRYHLSEAARDLVIFESNGRVESVTQSELSELDLSKLMSGQSKEVKRKAFLGERMFTSKIITVTDSRPYNAYYVLGHGEHDPKNSDQLGYSSFGSLIANSNVRVMPLNLIAANTVPADCDLLIIAGPVQNVLPEEIQKVDKYLTQGGRLFLLLNFRSPDSFRALLTKWGVAVGDNVVFDESNAHDTDRAIILQDYGSHPIVTPLKSIPLPMELAWPRSVERGADLSQSADAPQVTELVHTGPQGTTRDSFSPGVKFPAASPRDRHGAISVIAAVEKGSTAKVRLEHGSTRIVVAGDSSFLANYLIEFPGNREFGWHALNWLLDRSQLLGAIGPQPLTEYKLTMTESQTNSVRWLLLAVLPGSVLLFGLVVWFQRRH